MNVKKLDGFVEKFLLIDDNDDVVYKIIRHNKMFVVDRENNPVEKSVERKILSFLAQKLSDKNDSQIKEQTESRQSQPNDGLEFCFT